MSTHLDGASSMKINGAAYAKYIISIQHIHMYCAYYIHMYMEHEYMEFFFKYKGKMT